jgi:hypothetical protein
MKPFDAIRLFLQSATRNFHLFALILSIQRLMPRTFVDSVVVKLDAPFFVGDEVDLKRMNLLNRSGCCYRQPRILLILSMKDLLILSMKNLLILSMMNLLILSTKKIC